MSDSGFRLLEVSLIGAQDLKKKPSKAIAALRCTQAYAAAWVDPSEKLRTRVDRDGGENPTWNDKFLFRVPAWSLSPNSCAGLHVEICGAGCFNDKLLGTVRFLLGNLHMLESAPGVPFFAAAGIRRPSGRVQGVLNLGMTILPSCHVSVIAAGALAARCGAVAAVGYRGLMGENDDPGNWWHRAMTPSRTPAREPPKELKAAAVASGKEGSEDEEDRKGGERAVSLFGSAFLRRIHLRRRVRPEHPSYPAELTLKGAGSHAMAGSGSRNSVAWPGRCCFSRCCDLT